MIMTKEMGFLKAQTLFQARRTEGGVLALGCAAGTSGERFFLCAGRLVAAAVRQGSVRGSGGGLETSKWWTLGGPIRAGQSQKSNDFFLTRIPRSATPVAERTSRKLLFRPHRLRLQSRAQRHSLFAPCRNRCRSAVGRTATARVSTHVMPYLTSAWQTVSAFPHCCTPCHRQNVASPRYPTYLANQYPVYRKVGQVPQSNYNRLRMKRLRLPDTWPNLLGPWPPATSP
jgi:hypothetical protein